MARDQLAYGRPGWGIVAALTLLFWLSAMSVDAQYIKHLNAHQLLRASSVFQITRDSKGFLWFCTDHGLVKYDGRTAAYYTRQKGLPDDMVFNVFEDRQGRVWAFCYNGKYCFIDGDSIHNEQNDLVLAGLPHANAFLTCMAQAKDSSLYFGFSTCSILILKGAKWRWQEIHTPYENSLIPTDERLEYTPVHGLNILAADKKHRLLSDIRGLKIFLGDSLIWRLDEESLNHRAVTDLYLTDDRKLFVCTVHGLEIIDLDTRRRLKLLTGIRTSSCYTDVAGNFWIATLSNGVYLLHRDLDHIRRLEGFDGLEWTIVNEGKLVFIKNNALYELRHDAGELSASVVVHNIPNHYNPLLLTDRLSVFYDAWRKYPVLIPRSGGNARNSRVVVAAPDERIFFKKMHAWQADDFFAYGDRIVFHYRYEHDSFRFVDSTAFSQKISASCQDPRTGAVYFTCGDSLYQYHFDSSRAVALFSSPVLSSATSLVCRDSCIMIATGKHGYHSLFPVGRNGRLTTYDHGFTVRDVASVAHNGLLLFSDAIDYLLSPEKLSQSPPQKVQYPFSSTEYEQLGLIDRYCLVKLDGKHYYFDTSLLNRNQPLSRLYLKRLVINGREYTGQDIDIRNTIKLDIQLSIGLLDFGNNVHALRYRLSGPEGGDWNSTTANELAFVLRKAGTYEIQIVPDNGADTQPLRLSIRVHTPFLRSSTFYALCGATALLVCSGIVFLIVRRRKRLFLRELNYLRLEHRAINALLNPHFIFNSINNIQNLIHQSEQQDAAEYLAVLSRLIRQNLENLQFNLVPLENELALIRRYIKLQNLRFNGMLRLDIDAEAEGLQDVHIPPLLVHTFVENAIVHGFRHKNIPFCIRISISRVDDHYLRIAIRDNGVGLKAAEQVPVMHQQSSMGVSFNRKRLSRLSEFYRLDQSIALTDLAEDGDQGTEVVIVLFAGLKDLFEQKHLTAH